MVHDLLRDKQQEPGQKEPLLFRVSNWVQLENRRRRRKKSKPLRKFVGPYRLGRLVKTKPVSQIELARDPSRKSTENAEKR